MSIELRIPSGNQFQAVTTFKLENSLSRSIDGAVASQLDKLIPVGHAFDHPLGHSQDGVRMRFLEL